ncbi:MAG: hypothetical protein AAFY35_08305 [Pseudomonadota bacterium]
MRQKNLLNDKGSCWDHWWPSGIQRRIWTREDGFLSQRRGSIVRHLQPGRATGASHVSHYIELGDSPWTHSFENAFQEVDNKGAVITQKTINLIKETIQYKLCRWRTTRWVSRYSNTITKDAVFLSTSDLQNLTRLVVSIVIRSPTERFRMSLPIPATPEGTQISPEQGQLNLWFKRASWYQNPNLPTLPVSAIFFIGHWSTEFVIGDGFYQTFLDAMGWPEPRKGCVLFPLSPDICLLLKFNSREVQNLVNLSKEQTLQINQITCQSSREEIYFRNHDQPQFEPADPASHRWVNLEKHNFLRRWTAH